MPCRHRNLRLKHVYAAVVSRPLTSQCVRGGVGGEIYGVLARMKNESNNTEDHLCNLKTNANDSITNGVAGLLIHKVKKNGQA